MQTTVGGDGAASGRLEVQHVRYPGATWTSFDRYSRYSALAGLIRSCLGAGRHRILDVGDASGYLRAFEPNLEVVSLDPTGYGDPLPGAVRVHGDGVRLPFPDDVFDAVVSSDALEHVARPRRDIFLREAARVSRDLVAVAAPFDTPGVAGAEELVRRYALLTTGRPQEQLDEHREYGLPDLGETETVLSEGGREGSSRGNGNLHDWTAMMLLKHQLMPRQALAPLDGGFDIAYNYLLTGRNAVAPFYRHVVASRSAGRVIWPEPDGDDVNDAPTLLGCFLTANVSEVVRQDVVPMLQELGPAVRKLEGAFQLPLDSLNARVGALEAHGEAMELRLKGVLEEVLVLRAASESSAAQQSEATGLLRELHARLDTLAEALRHPFASLRRR